MKEFKKLLRSIIIDFKTNLRWSILTVTFLFPGLMGQDYSAGLRFYNKYDFVESGEFSSLDISLEDPIHFENEFTLSFDFSLRNPKPFGFIFQLKADSLPISLLSNVDFKHPDTTYLELSFQEFESMISIPIPKSELTPLNWFHLSVTYNMLFDEVRMVLNNDIVRVIKVPMLNEQDIRIIFGHTPDTQDVPSMTLKGIKLSDKTGPRHHWRLNEYSGVFAYDHIGGRQAEATNTQWEYESHTVWQLEDLIKLSGREVFAATENPAILTFVSDIIETYNIEIHGFIQIYPNVKMALKDGYYIFHNSIQEKIYGFHGNGTEYYTIDLGNNKETNYTIPGEENHYHTPAHFYDMEAHELYLIGGYGWYRTKNHIRQFDFVSTTWDTLAVWGDQFHPRFGATTSRGPDPNCIYIFGGVGNESGMQERGWRNFTGFWKFNRKTLELKKEGTFESLGEYTNISLGYSDEINRFLLTLSEKPYNNAPIKLVSINAETYEIENQSILPNSEHLKIGGLSKPFIGKKTGKLTIVTRKEESASNGVLIQMHTINYPPMDPPPVSFIESWGRYGFGIAALIVSLGIIGFRWKRNGEATEKQLGYAIAIDENGEDNPYLTHNFAIQCFGHFRLYKFGKELSPDDWVSKKARLLFIFIVLKGDGGVAPQRIQTQFWPDSPQKSAGNSRYVAMSQIRRMLNPFEGIIHTQEHNIFLDYNEDHFSDFHYFMSVVHANSHGDLSQMERALQLYDNGSLCEDINESWMDNIREDIRSKAKRLADNLSQSYQASDQWRKLGKLGQQVLRWDYLDDDGFHWAIMGLLNSHREAKAKSIYDTYTQYYLEVLDHPFEFSFKEIQFKYAKKV